MFLLSKKMPKGRKPVKTYVKSESEIKDVLTMMLEELKKGHQIYVIAPLIEESDNSDLTTVNELRDKFTLAFGSHFKIDWFMVRWEHFKKRRL